MQGIAGVSLHIPFCASRCDYCAFATWTDRTHLVDRYLAACRTELERALDVGLEPATSVFVGGGTPSLVPAAALVDVLRVIPLADGAEVTVECNPDTVTAELVDTYRAGGVNRLSFGVQSMVPHVLAALAPPHAPDNVRRSVELARAAGFETFNLDLIYGGAGESLEDWRRTLTDALALDPPHVSAYALTVEPGTALAADADRHPDDDDQADKYLLATELLGAHGLDWYEISNWARLGHECRHNELYWRQGDYLGVGCAAHSHRRGRRWWNLRTPERYIDAVDAHDSTEAAFEELDDEAQVMERLQLALRTREGVPRDALPDDGTLDGLVEPGDDGTVVLTIRGRLLANDVSTYLRPAGAPAPSRGTAGRGSADRAAPLGSPR